MRELHEKAFKVEHAIAGFRATGLYPVDKTKVGQSEIALSLTFAETEVIEPEDVVVAPITPFVMPIAQQSQQSPFIVSGRRLTFDSPATEPSLEQVSLALQQKLLANIQASIPKKKNAQNESKDIIMGYQ